MALVREMGFGAFESLPDYNLRQHMLKELVNIFDIRDNIIHSVHGELEITTQKIGKALGLSWNGGFPVDEKTLSEEDLAVFKMFQGKHQADLTRLVPRTPVDTEANQDSIQEGIFDLHPKMLPLGYIVSERHTEGSPHPLWS
ncbi:hypothetical protein PIB30_038958 [Stylosanthes scabra]|uniref:Uncharacterized protein n=1 Tax=Stylosanthes scabra TaxID=79078 RepID=A0ABU6VDQ5_9FABA|nr:hypothetical protein [Stylosanthes scabra]